MNKIQGTFCRIAAILLACFQIAGCGIGCAEAVAVQDPAAASEQNPEEVRVSYLGPEGTYTEEAAQFFFPDAETFQPKGTVVEAILDVVEDRADFAVIPQENTLGGAVTNYVDALIAEESVFVVGEVILPINQTLMGIPGASIEDIRMVYDNYDSFKTQILVASVRSPEHIINAGRIGADVVTAPPKVIRQLYHHPLTDSGLKTFAEDWAKTGQSIL